MSGTVHTAGQLDGSAPGGATVEAAPIEPPPGASVWEADMIRYLDEHRRTEGRLLQRYVDSAAATESKALAYMVSLLAEDEHRHHAWFGQLAEAVRSVALLDPESSPIPLPDFGRHDRAETAALLDDLIENEEDDRRELRRLRRQLRDVQDTTLWGVLVEMMLIDTEKHLAMLDYVRKHV